MGNIHAPLIQHNDQTKLEKNLLVRMVGMTKRTGCPLQWALTLLRYIMRFMISIDK